MYYAESYSSSYDVKHDELKYFMLPWDISIDTELSGWKCIALSPFLCVHAGIRS